MHKYISINLNSITQPPIETLPSEGGAAFFYTAEYVPDPDTVKLSMDAELFLKLELHCASHNLNSGRDGALIVPNISVLLLTV